MPPSLMFYFVFGRFDIGASFIVGLPMVYSLFRIPYLLWKKQNHRILRPILTLFYVFIFTAMGNHYKHESKKYVQNLARVMQEQCNRDGYCKIPAGNWKVSDFSEQVFYSNTKGLVPMRLVLTFNEVEPDGNGQCVSAEEASQKSKQFKTFHLERKIEDFDYEVYGGAGRSLNMP